MAETEQRSVGIEFERVHNGKEIVGAALPAVVEAVGGRRVAVAPEIDADPATAVEVIEHRVVHPAMKPRCMADQQSRAVAAVVVDGELDAVGGGHTLYGNRFGHRPVFIAE